MPTYIDTEPRLRVISTIVLASDFTIVNQSRATGVYLPSKSRILSVEAWKEVPFDMGNMMIGHGAVSAQRRTIASEGDVAATATGTSTCDGWRATANSLLLTSSEQIYARIEGTVPATGKVHIWITVMDLTPRDTA